MYSIVQKQWERNARIIFLCLRKLSKKSFKTRTKIPNRNDNSHYSMRNIAVAKKVRHNVENFNPLIIFNDANSLTYRVNVQARQVQESER